MLKFSFLRILLYLLCFSAIVSILSFFKFSQFTPYYNIIYPYIFRSPESCAIPPSPSLTAIPTAINSFAGSRFPTAPSGTVLQYRLAPHPHETQFFANSNSNPIPPPQFPTIDLLGKIPEFAKLHPAHKDSALWLSVYETRYDFGTGNFHLLTFLHCKPNEPEIKPINPNNKNLNQSNIPPSQSQPQPELPRRLRTGCRMKLGEIGDNFPITPQLEIEEIRPEIDFIGLSLFCKFSEPASSSSENSSPFHSMDSISVTRARLRIQHRSPAEFLCPYPLHPQLPSNHTQLELIYRGTPIDPLKLKPEYNEQEYTESGIKILIQELWNKIKVKKSKKYFKSSMNNHQLIPGYQYYNGKSLDYTNNILHQSSILFQLKLNINAYYDKIYNIIWCSAPIHTEYYIYNFPEFIDHYMYLGIEHFELLDRTGYYYNSLLEYRKSSILTYKYIPYNSNWLYPTSFDQIYQLESCRYRYYYSSKWIGVFDIDEFLVFPKLDGLPIEGKSMKFNGNNNNNNENNGEEENVNDIEDNSNNNHNNIENNDNNNNNNNSSKTTKNKELPEMNQHKYFSSTCIKPNPKYKEFIKNNQNIHQNNKEFLSPFHSSTNHDFSAPSSSSSSSSASTAPLQPINSFIYSFDSPVESIHNSLLRYPLKLEFESPNSGDRPNFPHSKLNYMTVSSKLYLSQLFHSHCRSLLLDFLLESIQWNIYTFSSPFSYNFGTSMRSISISTTRMTSRSPEFFNEFNKYKKLYNQLNNNNNNMNMNMNNDGNNNNINNGNNNPNRLLIPPTINSFDYPLLLSYTFSVRMQLMKSFWLLNSPCRMELHFPRTCNEEDPVIYWDRKSRYENSIEWPTISTDRAVFLHFQNLVSHRQLFSINNKNNNINNNNPTNNNDKNSNNNNNNNKLTTFFSSLEDRIPDPARKFYDKNNEYFHNKYSTDQNRLWAKQLVDKGQTVNQLGPPIKYINSGRIIHYARMEYFYNGIH